MAHACGRGLAWHWYRLSLADTSLQGGQAARSGGGQQALLAPWTAGLGQWAGGRAGSESIHQQLPFLGNSSGCALALSARPGLFVRVDDSAYRQGSLRR